jgi:polysaccharide biosynthesis transport protein
MKSLQDETSAVLVDSMDDVGDAQAPSIDIVAIGISALRRWKLITTIMLLALISAYGALKLVPPRYTSTVDVLVFDPQQQINSQVQKPISPFVEAIGDDAMDTEIEVLKSKSVALRVADELGLEKDPEFQPHNLPADLAERLGFLGLSRALRKSGHMEDEKAERLDLAADALIKNLQIRQNSYILSVTTTSESPIMAQRLAAAIARDYLASQREAREEALQRVATWLKSRVDGLQSQILETEAAIQKLRADNDISASELNELREKQIVELNTQLMKARAEVEEKRSRLDQVRSVIASNGDVQSIPELTASTTLTELRREQVELTSRLTDLRNKLGDRHVQVIAVRTQLDALKQEISAEAEHILGNMKNTYDISVRQEQSLEANLQSLTARASSETYAKLEQLQRVADADHKLYDSYLSQYNDISERRTLQDATARIISPATFPRSPSSPKKKIFYALGLVVGLGGGFLLAFVLEYLLRPGVRTGTELERSFGRPVVGAIPLIQRGRLRRSSHGQVLHRIVNEPFSPLNEAAQSVRISLKLSAASSKVILITSPLPGEGKSTTAMLLAISSAASGTRTILIDCDLRRASTSAALQKTGQPGLSELLLGTAELADVITQDPITETYLIPAGSGVPNVADLLMSQQMQDLVGRLRDLFDYIVLDTPPLLLVVDALALATVADKILVIVEWSQTASRSISEAFKILRPEAHRVAGIVLNKVDLNRLPGYRSRSGYHYSYGAQQRIRP